MIASRATLGPAAWALDRALALGLVATVRAVAAAGEAEGAEEAEEAVVVAVATMLVGVGAPMTPMMTAVGTGDVVWI